MQARRWQARVRPGDVAWFGLAQLRIRPGRFGLNSAPSSSWGVQQTHGTMQERLVITSSGGGMGLKQSVWGGGHPVITRSSVEVDGEAPRVPFPDEATPGHNFRAFDIRQRSSTVGKASYFHGHRSLRCEVPAAPAISMLSGGPIRCTFCLGEERLTEYVLQVTQASAGIQVPCLTVVSCGPSLR